MRSRACRRMEGKEMRAKVDSLYLQRTQYGESLVIPMYHLVGGKTKLDSLVQPWVDGYEFRLTTYFGEHIIVDRKEVWPASWWEALKDRFLPKSLRKYFPVKYKTLEVKVSEVASKFVLPERMGPIPFMKWDKRDFTDSGDEL